MRLVSKAGCLCAAGLHCSNNNFVLPIATLTWWLSRVMCSRKMMLMPTQLATSM